MHTCEQTTPNDNLRLNEPDFQFIPQHTHKRRLVNLTKIGTLDQSKDKKIEKMGRKLSRKLSKIQKLNKKLELKGQIMPGSGVASFTNYQMNSRQNPYLAPQSQQIMGYQMKNQGNMTT